jgi:hypothetical protein
VAVLDCVTTAVAVAAPVVAVAAAVVAVAWAGVGVAVAAAVVVVAWAGVGVAVAALTAATITVPVMLGWISQWYVNVPAASNVLAKLAPLLIVPESKTPAVSEVTVCGMPASLCAQVTDSPTFTLTLPGANAKFAMETFAFAACAGRAAPARLTRASTAKATAVHLPR